MLTLIAVLPLLRAAIISLGSQDAASWKFINEPASAALAYPCAFSSLIGANPIHSKDTVAALQLSIPFAHYKLRVRLDYYFVDVDEGNWQDYALLQLDQEIYSRSFQLLEPTSNACGDPLQKDDFKAFTVDLRHFRDELTILVGASHPILERNVVESFWAFKNFEVFYFECPAGCDYCADDVVCLSQVRVYQFWRIADIYLVSSEGWNTNAASQVNTQCGEFAIFGGGSNNFGHESDIFRTVAIGGQTSVSVQFELWTYNFDCGRGIDFYLDDSLYDTIQMDCQNYFHLCPSSSFTGNSLMLAEPQEYVRLRSYQVLDYPTMSPSVKLQFKVNSSGDSSGISWGFRNFDIYTCTDCLPKPAPASCIQGQFLDLNSVCQDCNYRCLACSGPEKHHCTACDSYVGRVPQLLMGESPFLCACQPGSYDDFEAQDALCQKCHYSCLTCNGPYRDDCLTCDPATLRTYVNHLVDPGLSPNEEFCNCPQGYYSQPANPLCQPCHDDCLSCFGPSSNNCLQCKAPELVLVDGQCSCAQGTYQLAPGTCSPCPPSCLTCTDNSSCTSCDNSRDLDQLAQCVCKPSTHDVAGLCCHDSCLTCATPSLFACLTCDSALKRHFQAGQCLCDQRYFDYMQSPACQPCHHSCLTCSGSSQYDCLTCDPADYRYFSYNECRCSNNYYDLTNYSQCQKCHLSCIQCNGATEYDCTQCNQIYREADFAEYSSGKCDCRVYSYDDGIGNCLPCHYSCIRCSGPNKNQCLECSIDYHKRVLDGSNNCGCTEKYYDLAGNSACQPCSYSCRTCSGPALNHCLSCDGAAFRVHSPEFSTCQCAPGKFEDQAKACQDCHPTCLRCSSALEDKCVECSLSDFRHLEFGRCVCDSRKFDNGVACQDCHSSCMACIGPSSSECSNCDSAKRRAMLNNQCLCEDGFYELANQELCQKCHHSCLTCSGASQCLSCDATKLRYLRGSECVCEDSYFDDGLSAACQVCDQSCLTCSWLDRCVSCLEPRVLESEKCVCGEGKYEESKGCQNCHPSCASCFGPLESQCGACDAARVQVGTYCKCRAGTFEEGGVCAGCDATCGSCEKASECLSCEEGTRQLAGVECVCREGSFEQEGECVGCHYSCLTCSGPDECASCDGSRYRVQEGHLCRCALGTYEEQGQSSCLQCHYSCLDCLGPGRDQCVSCDTASTARQLLDHSCVCPQGTLDLNQPACLQQPLCHYQCLQCDPDDPALCLACDPTRTLLANRCPCVEGKLDIPNAASCQDPVQCPPLHFTQNNQCFPCHYACSTCSGPAYTDCLASRTTLPIYLASVYPPLQSLFHRYMEIALRVTVTSNQQTQADVHYRWELREVGQLVVVQQSEELYDGEFTIAVLPYTLKVDQKYQLQLLLWDSANPEMKLGPSYEWYVQKSEVKLLVKGGNREVSVSDRLVLEGQILDLDLQYEPIEDAAGYGVEWRCTDLLYGSDCVDRHGKALVLRQGTLTQQFDSLTFPSSQTYRFTLRSGPSEASVAVSFVLERLVPMALRVDQQYLQRAVNLNEVMELEFEFPASVTGNFYSLSVYHDSELKASVEVRYRKFRLRLADHLSTPTSSQVSLKGVLFNPSYPLPSTSSLDLLLNLPPRDCLILTHPAQLVEFQRDSAILLQGCLDTHLPLQYRFGFYASPHLDVLAHTHHHLNVLCDYTLSPTCPAALACSPTTCTLLLFVQVQDALGATANFTKTIDVLRAQSLDLPHLTDQVLSQPLDHQLKLVPIIVNRLKGTTGDKAITHLKNQLLHQLIHQRAQCQDKAQLVRICKQISLLSSEPDVSPQLPDPTLTKSIIENLLSMKRELKKSPNQMNERMEMELEVAASLALEVDAAVSKWELESVEESEYLLGFTEELSEVLGMSAYPNEGARRMETSQFSVSSSIMTLAYLEELMGPVAVGDGSRVTQEEEDELYKYRMVRTKQNPYRSEAGFPYKAQNARTASPRVTKVGREEEVQPKSRVVLDTGVEPSDKNQTCVSKSEKGEWVSEECETHQRKHSVDCDCKLLQPTTVVDDVEGMFSKSLVASDSLEDIARFKWWLTVIFYIISALTIVTVVLGFYGYLLDLKEKDKIVPVREDEEAQPPSPKKGSILIMNDDTPVNFARRDRDRKTQLTIFSTGIQKRRQSTTKIWKVEPDSKDGLSQLSKYNPDSNPNENNFEAIFNKELDLQSKSQTKRELQVEEKKKKKKKPFKQYFLENYQWTNVIYVFEKELGRPLRASLIYLTAIVELVATLYFGRQFTIQKILIVVGISAVATKILVTVFKKSIGAESRCMKALGCLLYLATWGGLVFIALAQVASQGSEEQANIWALQYAINFTTENFVISVLELVVKYLMGK